MPGEVIEERRAADSGRVQVGGLAWLDTARGVRLPPQRRPVGMVFQDYALFANMTVAANIGYGLPRPGRETGHHGLS